MTAREVVTAYLAALGLAVRALVQSTDGVERAGATMPMTAVIPGGKRVRVVEVHGLGTLRIHGRGCVAEFESGEDVDFDWDADGHPVFDAWRLRSFSRSIGLEMSAQELMNEARSMARSGILKEIPGGWFRVV